VKCKMRNAKCKVRNAQHRMLKAVAVGVIGQPVLRILRLALRTS
jgi:hypothetical protein